MRGLVMAGLLLVAVAMAPLAARAEGATPATAAAGTDQAPAQGEGWFGASAGPSADETMRTMYISMGAMAGYMFAVMPLTTAAVTAAVASGVASMWAYDYLVAPNGAPVH